MEEWVYVFKRFKSVFLPKMLVTSWEEIEGYAAWNVELNLIPEQRQGRP